MKLWLVLICLLWSSCATHYLAPNFGIKTQNHQIIAVLPVEMIYSGRIPEDWTQEDLMRIEEAESQSFQIAFHRAILRSKSNRTYKYQVQLQDYRETLRILKEHQLGIRQTWHSSAQELVQILGVQAVIRARIEKERYMSDLASYGIEVASHVINLVTNYYLSPVLPFTHISK